MVECKLWRGRVSDKKVAALAAICDDLGADRGLLPATEGRVPLLGRGRPCVFGQVRLFFGRCPWLSARSASRCRRPRTYGGQRRRGKCHSAAFAQLRAYVIEREVACCKTVGSAYVGSNPTPATTCGNGPLAADTRQAGRFLLVTPCIVVCHRESMRCGVHGRIADGVHAIRTVGAHRRLFRGRPRTGRAGGVFPGLTRGAESGVHPCVPAGALGGFPGRGAGRGRRMR